MHERTHSAKYDPKKKVYGPLKLYYKPNIHTKGSFKFQLENFKIKSQDNKSFSLRFEYKTGNPEFTRMLTRLKICFFLISVVLFFVFRKKLNHQSSDSWVIEQTMVKNLSIFLIGFNDPLQSLLLYEPTLLK